MYADFAGRSERLQDHVMEAVPILLWLQVHVSALL